MVDLANFLAASPTCFAREDEERPLSGFPANVVFRPDYSVPARGAATLKINSDQIHCWKLLSGIGGPQGDAIQTGRSPERT